MNYRVFPSNPGYRVLSEYLYVRHLYSRTYLIELKAIYKSESFNTMTIFEKEKEDDRIWRGGPGQRNSVNANRWKQYHLEVLIRETGSSQLSLH